MPKRVTFLIPIRNADQLHVDALRSVTRQSASDIDVVVLGIGTGNDAPALLKEFPAVTYLSVPAGTRTSEAMNRGLMVCETPLVAMVEPGIVLAPDWLDVLLDAIAVDLHVYAACGKVVEPGDSGRIEAVGEGVDELGCRYPIGAGDDERLTWKLAREVFGPHPAAVLLRRKLFSMIGPFDGAYGAGFEFADLSLRFRWLGLKAIYLPTARAMRIEGTKPPPAPPLSQESDRLRLFFKCFPQGMLWVNAPRVLTKPLGVALFSGLWFLTQFLRALPGLLSRRREVHSQAAVYPQYMFAWLRAEPTRNPLFSVYRAAVEAVIGPQGPAPIASIPAAPPDDAGWN